MQCQGPQLYLPSVCSGNESVGLFGDTKTLVVFLIKVGCDKMPCRKNDAKDLVFSLTNCSPSFFESLF